MCTYLAKRGATYYFRRPVPEELRPLLDGRREWMVSLRTKDREAAKRAIPTHTIATDRMIDEARAALGSQSPQNATGKAVQRRSDAEARIEAARDEMTLWAAEAAAEADAEREARYAARAEMREYLRARHRLTTMELTPQEVAMRDLVRAEAFNAESLRQQIVSLKARLSEAKEKGDPDLIRRLPAQPVQRESAAPLLSYYDQYVAEQGIKARTAREWRAIIKGLIDFLGHDDAARITVDDLDRWREHLLSEKGSRGRSRSSQTVKGKYLSAIRATLNYMVEKRKLPENVALKVVVRVRRPTKLRDRNFTGDEIKAILSATMEEPPANLGRHARLIRRWVPWLCAYTGARVNEIGQLRGRDVTQIDGIWTIRITPEAGTVKDNSARIVPLHPHLIEQGFPVVAQVAGDAPIFYDPSKVRKPGEANRHFKKVGEHLATWVRTGIGITDPNVQPNHGWRHTFKTMALEAGVPERIADAIQGHAPKTVGQTYGSVSVTAMAEAIQNMPRFGNDDGA